jgi:hypothetical protein
MTTSLKCGFWLIVVVVASFACHHGQAAVVSCMKGIFFHAPQFISRPIMMASKMLTSLFSCSPYGIKKEQNKKHRVAVRHM